MHHLTFQSCNLARSRPVRKRSDGGNACLFRHFTERASKFPQQKAYRFLRRVVCYVTFLLFSGSCSRAFALSAHEAFGRKNFFETSRFSPTANAPPPPHPMHVRFQRTPADPRNPILLSCANTGKLRKRMLRCLHRFVRILIFIFFFYLHRLF